MRSPVELLNIRDLLQTRVAARLRLIISEGGASLAVSNYGELVLVLLPKWVNDVLRRCGSALDWCHEEPGVRGLMRGNTVQLGSSRSR